MPYRPTRDPVVLLLALIVVAAVVAMLTGVGVTLSGSGGSDPVLPFPEGGDNETLSISVNRTTVSPGDPVEVTVTWPGGEPVTNATVTAAARRYRTGPNGTVVVSFEEAGTRRIAARLPGENETAPESASVEVRVGEPTTGSTGSALVADRSTPRSDAGRDRFASTEASSRRRD